MIEIPCDRVGHFVRISVGLPDGSSARFLVDTGIGITVVSTAFMRRLGLSQPGRSFTGHRMSGQAVEVPLVELPSLELGSLSPAAGSGGFAVVSGVAGVADLGATDGPGGFDGILGLDMLGELVLTVDPFRSLIGFGGPAAVSGQTNVEVPARLHREGPAIDIRADLRLPDDTVIEVEVDTGSTATILADRWMGACAVEGSEPSTRTEEGTDETGHHYVRRFIPIEGAIALCRCTTDRAARADSDVPGDRAGRPGRHRVPRSICADLRHHPRRHDAHVAGGQLSHRSVARRPLALPPPERAPGR